MACAVSTETSVDRVSVTLESTLEVDSRVALRPEPFGALAYHYGNRRLIFLKHPDVVTVIKALAHHPDLRSTLTACAIASDRWPTFVAALSSLYTSEIVRDRVITG